MDFAEQFLYYNPRQDYPTHTQVNISEYFMCWLTVQMTRYSLPETVSGSCPKDQEKRESPERQQVGRISLDSAGPLLWITFLRVSS